MYNWFSSVLSIVFTPIQEPGDVLITDFFLTLGFCCFHVRSGATLQVNLSCDNAFSEECEKQKQKLTI